MNRDDEHFWILDRLRGAAVTMRWAAPLDAPPIKIAERLLECAQSCEAVIRAYELKKELNNE